MATTQSSSSLLNRAGWTIATFASSFALRLGSNIVLTRLLAPEIFGVMVLVNSIRYGVELLTDVGIEQNIVHSKRGLDATFLNTAWTLQIVRGLLLSCLFFAVSPTIGRFYHVDVLVFYVISFAPFIGSCSSTAVFCLVKNLRVRERNLFELGIDLFGFLVYVVLANITPTIWALLGGTLTALAFRASVSYLLPHPKHRLVINKDEALEIIGFGKWIMLSSFLIYASSNVDRIYLGKVLSLESLGIFGIAKTIADLPATLAGRISYQILFPALAQFRKIGDRSAASISELAAVRLKFVSVTAVSLAVLAGTADIAIRHIYDSRYEEAGWMLFVLVSGSWISVLSNLNEAILLGVGRPAYNGLANACRLICLIVILPTSFHFWGLPGAVTTLSACELARYACIAVGQFNVNLPYWRQDLVATTLAVVTLAGIIFTRFYLNAGMPWSGFTH